MEKYCPKCNKIFDDMKFKYCPICTGELIVRQGRVPIPQGLRNEVLKRDGYRCVRCGASRNDPDVRLEIDHIIPVAKGGTNEIDNLQTLCHECNINKGAIIEDNDDIEIKENDLNSLKKVISKKEESLKITNDEDERLDLEFDIITLKKQIPLIENEIKQLKDKRDKEEADSHRKQREKERKDRLFKKIYVELEKEDDEIYLRICKHFSLNYQTREENLKNLAYNYPEEEIYNVLTSIKKSIEKEKEEQRKREKQILYDKLYYTLNDKDIELIKKQIDINGSKEEIITHLVNTYTESELAEGIKFIKETIEKEEQRKREEEQKKLEEEQRKREKQILYDELYALDDDELTLIKEEFSLNCSKEEIIAYLINNYSKSQINSLKTKILSEILFDELNQKDILIFSKKLKVPYEKKAVVKYLVENYTLVEIRDLKERFNKDNESQVLWNLELKRMENHLSNKLTYTNYKLIIKEYSLPHFDLLSLKSYLILNYSQEEIDTMLSSKNNNNEIILKVPRGLIQCPFCSAWNPKNALSCKLCHYDFKQGTRHQIVRPSSNNKKICPNCKTESHLKSKRCSYCGHIF